MFMRVSKKIRQRINARKELELFSFGHIVKKDESHAAIAKELSRLYSKGVIHRLHKGVYYKPKESRFGQIKPSENDIIQYLLFEKGKQVGYISGERSYNYLGLTSQVPSVVTIATNQNKRSGKFANLNVRYVKAYGQVGKDDPKLLRILDSIKEIDRILGASISKSLNSLYQIIKDLSPSKKKELVRIVDNYPPRVKALVGAMMSRIWENKSDYKLLLRPLKNGIPNTSKFEYSTINNLLNNTKEWNLHDPALANG